MKQKHYMSITSPGPLMIVRVPWPMPRWREIMRATTAVMRSHGLRQKDIWALDGLVEANPKERTEESRQLATRLDRGYDGLGSVLPGFHLYDWQDGVFKLSRGATEGP